MDNINSFDFTNNEILATPTDKYAGTTRTKTIAVTEQAANKEEQQPEVEAAASPLDTDFELRP